MGPSFAKSTTVLVPSRPNFRPPEGSALRPLFLSWPYQSNTFHILWFHLRKRSPSLRARAFHCTLCLALIASGRAGESGGRQIEWLLTEERMNHLRERAEPGRIRPGRDRSTHSEPISDKYTLYSVRKTSSARFERRLSRLRVEPYLGVRCITATKLRAIRNTSVTGSTRDYRASSFISTA